MKKILIITVIIFCFNIEKISAVTFEDISSAEMGISVTAHENIEKVSDNFSFSETAKSIAEGSYAADASGAFKKLVDILFAEISANARVMAAVILLGIITSFVSNISSSFSSSGASEAVFMCSYAVLAGISASGFYEISECAKTAVEDMGLFVKALIPVLTMLSAAEGRVISATALHGQVIATAAIGSFIIESVIIPLAYASFAIKLINNMTDAASLNNLSKMTDKFSKRIMGFMMLIFTGVLNITAFAAGTAENMGMKTARFALNTFIPVTGGALAETVTSICASAGMIKNSAGIAGIVAIVLIAAYPVVKCIAVSFIYNFTGAILEPVTDSRLSSAVTAVGECMGMLLATVSVTAAQYIISAAVLFSAYGRG